ncbi:MAG: hypothetical protein KDJ14_17065 [Xanthomonadales bacterium]|nr:hypothetical protein [Xanthomonadales bacterium]
MLRGALLLIGLLCVSASAHAVTHEVTLSGFSFTPSSLTIQVGDTVRWRNQGGFHDVVADDTSFSSGAATSAPFTFEVTFNTPGTFGYHCSIHGSPGAGMAGTIIVEGTTPPPEPTPPDINFATSGAWFNPQTSGQGFFVEAFPGASVFTLAWFTWIDQGDHDWFVATGLFEGPTATVDVFRVVGGRFNDPTPVTDSVIGTATFTLIDCTHAEFAFNLIEPMRSGTIALERILPSDDACVVPAVTVAPLSDPP